MLGCLSCGSPTRKEAQKLNNSLVTINDSVASKDKALEDCIAQAVKDKDYARVAPVRQKFEDYIDSCGREVKHMTDTGGSEQMRRAELAVLGWEKSMLHNDLVLYEKMKPEAEASYISVLFQIVEKDRKKEADLVAKFEEIRQEYAKKNGF